MLLLKKRGTYVIEAVRHLTAGNDISANDIINKVELQTIEN